MTQKYIFDKISRQFLTAIFSVRKFENKKDEQSKNNFSHKRVSCVCARCLFRVRAEQTALRSLCTINQKSHRATISYYLKISTTDKFNLTNVLLLIAKFAINFLGHFRS